MGFRIPKFWFLIVGALFKVIIVQIHNYMGCRQQHKAAAQSCTQVACLLCTNKAGISKCIITLHNKFKTNKK